MMSSSTSWLWWPLDKVLRLLVDMTNLLRRNLTFLALSTSAFWRRGIKPPPPSRPPPGSSSSITRAPNKKGYLCIDMEPAEGTDEIPGMATLDNAKDVDVDDADNANLKRGFNSTSTSTPSSPFPSEQGRSGLHSKRPKLTFDEKKDKRLKAKEKRKSKFESRMDNDDEEQADQNKEDARPNYFVAFRVSNPEILENVQKVQERMLNHPVTSLTTCKSGHVFKETLISVHKLHFTLHVMQLQNEEQINKACEVLQKVYDRVKEDYVKNPLNIPIQGMDHFRNSVLFAKIHEDENIRRVEELSTLVRNEYESVGFLGDLKSFRPHMTIAKMSKAKKLYKKKIRAFPREIWEKDEHTIFGNQIVEGIQLLSMMESDPLTKYYKCIAQFTF